VKKTTGFVVTGLFVALLLAGFVSNFASSSPDGLDAATTRGCTVATDGTITGGTCMAQGAKQHELTGSPLADYTLPGVNHWVSTAIVGVTGVLATFALAGLLFRLARRRGPAIADADAARPVLAGRG
jgi:cobalt/nickel transport protein